MVHKKAKIACDFFFGSRFAMIFLPSLYSKVGTKNTLTNE